MLTLSVTSTASAQGGFNQPGNILISDQFNNRVIEVDPASGKIVWKFGNGSSVAGPLSVVAPNDAQRVGDLTLIAGTGAPQGTEPGCANAPCLDNRVIVVNEAKQIVWQYGEAGVSGSKAYQLNTPVQATFLPNKDVLITDQGNQRVIEVNQNQEIVWQYGKNGVAGAGFDELNNPNSAELLQNGDILIADENNNRVIEVNRNHRVVWSYNDSGDPSVLSGAAFASRLCNGNTLITDSNNNRVLEVDASGNVVSTYYTNTQPGSIANPFPTRAIRMCGGNTLISNQFDGQVIEVNPQGVIVFSIGEIGVNGNGKGQLNAPYDAKEVGDYVGITPPFGGFFPTPY
jgi:predicted secreted protein